MSDHRPAAELEKVIIRLPDGMRERLKSAADANGRSVNAEIVARLNVSFGMETATPGMWHRPELIEQTLRVLDDLRYLLAQPELTHQIIGSASDG